MLEELFKSRLIFVTGKGGVGKSTITSAMGIFFKSAGKRPLLVEFFPDKSIDHIFNIKADTYREIEINRDLLYFNISSADALAEYIKRQLILDVISRFVMNTKFYRYFSSTAPGLKELVSVGKLYDLEKKRDDNGQYLYDPIIVDAPQLGKFIPFIKTPQTIMNMFRIGPVKKEAERVNNLILSNKCSVIIVSTPDEMATTEALEAKKELQEMGRPRIRAIVVNMSVSKKIKIMDAQYYKQRVEKLSSMQTVNMPVMNALERLMNYTKMENRSIETMNKKVTDIPVYILPLIETPDNELFIAESLAGYFKGISTEAM